MPTDPILYALDARTGSLWQQHDAATYVEIGGAHILELDSPSRYMWRLYRGSTQIGTYTATADPWDLADAVAAGMLAPKPGEVAGG